MEQNNREKPVAKRRQNRCCDQCRQSRKACDGVLATKISLHDKKCSSCLRKGKNCTFRWVKRQTNSSKRATKSPHSPFSPRSPYASKSLRSPSGCRMPWQQPRSWTGTEAYFDNLHAARSDIAWDAGWSNSVHTNIAPTKAHQPLDNAGAPSCDFGAPIDLLGDLPIVTSDEPDDSTGHATLEYDQLLPVDGAQTGGDQQHLSFSDNGGFITWSTAQEGSDVVARHRSSHSPGFSSPQQLLVTGATRSSMMSVLLQTYTGCFETRMNWHGVSTEVPSKPATRSPAFEPVQTPAAMYKSWYERAVDMDNMADQLHIRESPLSASQRKLASHALQRAMLAMAAQWDAHVKARQRCRGRLQQARLRTGRNATFAIHETAEDTAGVISYNDNVVRKSLYRDALRGVDAAAGIDSFRTMLAAVILTCFKALRELTENGAEANDVPSGLAVPDKIWCFQRALAWKRRIRNFRGGHNQPKLWATFQATFNAVLWNLTCCDSLSAMFHWKTAVVAQDGISVSKTVIPGPAAWEKYLRLGPRERLPIWDTVGEAAGHISLEQKRLQWENVFLQEDSAAGVVDLSWPYSEAEMFRIMRQSIHVRMMLTRRISRLQHLMRVPGHPEVIEQAIDDCLAVYWRWQQNYGAFAKAILDNYHQISPVLQNMHGMCFVIWYYICICLAEIITSVDVQGLGVEVCRQNRNARGAAQEIALECARTHARVSRACQELDDLYCAADMPESGMESLVDACVVWGYSNVLAFSKSAEILSNAYCVAQRDGTYPGLPGVGFDHDVLIRESEDCTLMAHALSPYQPRYQAAVDAMPTTFRATTSQPLGYW